MKGNKPRSRVGIDRLARTATGICGFYSIMPRAAPAALFAPEYNDALRAFLAKRSRYGKHR